MTLAHEGAAAGSAPARVGLRAKLRGYSAAFASLVQIPIATGRLGLELVPDMFFIGGMDRISPDHIVAALRAAPAYARIGLSVRSERLRERATRDLAQFVAESLNGMESPRDARDQLLLPL